MDLLKDKYTIGVIVGRFQVPELTGAHKNIIQGIIDTHKQTIICIGVTSALGTRSNPLGYQERMWMIKEEFSSVTIIPMPDQETDTAWGLKLDSLIRSICPLGSVCLYGGRDSFIKSYSGNFPTLELPIINTDAGTKIRTETGQIIFSSIDFRKGVIYSTQNRHPIVYPTVDIAVVKEERDHTYVLMGKRTPDCLLRFPGGFVDPTDNSYEDAAKRELHEEVDIEIGKEMRYITSTRIDDWRYKKDEKIQTIFFRATYSFGTGKPDKKENEFCKTTWVEIDNNSMGLVDSVHQPLMEALIRNLGRE